MSRWRTQVTRTLVLALVVLALAPVAARGETTRLRYGTWGFDTAGMDRFEPPGDGFFRYANGGWIDRTPIPHDRPASTLRLLMTQASKERLRLLLEESGPDTPREPADGIGKIGAFYRSFMDEKRLESLGTTPLQAHLVRAHAARTRDDVCGVMGRSAFDVGRSIFGIGIDVDAKFPTRWAVTLNQDGLGLPDREYYLRPSFAKEKAEYAQYVRRLLTLIDWPDPAVSAGRIVRLETAIARASWTRAGARQIDATYNPMNPLELQRHAPGFCWRTFLEHAKLGSVSRLLVSEKTAFPKIATVFASTPLDTWRAWLAFTAADKAGPYLSREFGDLWFHMYRRTLQGQRQEEPRWERAVNVVAGDPFDEEPSFGSLRWVVGDLYVARYFGTEPRTQIEAIAAGIKMAFRSRLEHLAWMSPSTRAIALQKLESFEIHVGAQRTPTSRPMPAIIADDLLGNVRRSAEADWDYSVRRLGRPLDRSEWRTPPQTNNSFIFDDRNIFIPAGLLQPPLFDPSADRAINYGGIGALIGHELTHGFDDQGRKVDPDGKLRDWWVRGDARRFRARAAMLAAQYSAYEPLPGARVNGELTLGENIADLGGVTLALDAYRASLEGTDAPRVDGFSGEQRLFLGWAQAWRGVLSESALRDQLVSDTHSPRRYRVDGVVRNLDDWYTAFDVKPGAKLYLPPARRVRIW